MNGQSKDANKIFIGGISWETTEQDLKNHFEPFGALTDCVVMRDKGTGKARGFGFVSFAEASAADRVLATKHDILGRTVEVKSAVPRGEMGSGGRGEDVSQRVSKIFVGGLPAEVTDAQFREYFSQFGNITDSTVMVDKETNRSRGFGFVTFDNWQVVDQILRRSDHTLNGKVIEIKKAYPKGQGPDNRDRGGPMGRGGMPRFGGGGGGGGYGGGGNYGGMDRMSEMYQMMMMQMMGGGGGGQYREDNRGYMDRGSGGGGYGSGGSGGGYGSGGGGYGGGGSGYGGYSGGGGFSGGGGGYGNQQASAAGGFAGQGGGYAQSGFGQGGGFGTQGGGAGGYASPAAGGRDAGAGYDTWTDYSKQQAGGFDQSGGYGSAQGGGYGGYGGYGGDTYAQGRGGSTDRERRFHPYGR